MPNFFIFVLSQLLAGRQNAFAMRVHVNQMIAKGPPHSNFTMSGTPSQEKTDVATKATAPEAVQQEPLQADLESHAPEATHPAEGNALIAKARQAITGMQFVPLQQMQPDDFGRVTLALMGISVGVVMFGVVFAMLVFPWYSQKCAAQAASLPKTNDALIVKGSSSTFEVSKSREEGRMGTHSNSSTEAVCSDDGVSWNLLKKKYDPIGSSDEGSENSDEGIRSDGESSVGENVDPGCCENIKPAGPFSPGSTSAEEPIGNPQAPLNSLLHSLQKSAPRTRKQKGAKNKKRITGPTECEQGQDF